MSRFFYEPFVTFSDLDTLFDRAFEQHSSRAPAVQHQGQNDNSSLTRSFKPRMDLHESESSNQITATFELPGLKKEDVSIDIHNGRLTVSGETNISNEKASENGYSIRERRYGKFQRSLPLPKGVKAEDVKATMENGVLNVTFPRAGPEQQPQRITIS